MAMPDIGAYEYPGPPDINSLLALKDIEHAILLDVELKASVAGWAWELESGYT